MAIMLISNNRMMRFHCSYFERKENFNFIQINPSFTHVEERKDFRFLNDKPDYYIF